MSITEIRSAVLNPCSETTIKLFQAAGTKYVRYDARTVYLAYAFVRGVPYRVGEPTARPLFDNMGHYQYTFIENITKLVNYINRNDAVTPLPATKDTITAWVAVPEPEAHKARRLAREEKSKQAREARRQAFIQTAQRTAERVTQTPQQAP